MEKVLYTNSISILLGLFFLMNLLDWITGWMKSRYKKKENSQIGKKGIIKKVGCWLTILLSFILAYSFQIFGEYTGIDMMISSLLSVFVIVSFIVNEARSVLENLVECNIKVPLILIKGLEVFKEKIENNDNFKNKL